MGHFIDLAAVLAPEQRVKDYLASAGLSGGAGCLAGESGRTLVLFEEATGEFTRIAKMSEALQVPVFALHIHDDDLWMYEFYTSGRLADRFNTQPGYWQEIEDGERETWKGDANVLATYWSGLKPESVSNYLVHQDLPGFDGHARAYPDDHCESWDCWQVCDFLKKLGTPYPED
jgi:hypothetical protein